jgi:hypothetical protein
MKIDFIFLFFFLLNKKKNKKIKMVSVKIYIYGFIIFVLFAFYFGLLLYKLCKEIRETRRETQRMNDLERELAEIEIIEVKQQLEIIELFKKMASGRNN